MVAVSPVQVEAALPKVEPGLRKYRLIQERLYCCDVSTDRDFQRQFDHFYRVRKNQEWRTCFFGLLERAKRCGTSFHDTLDCVQRATGNVEASFASKLVATIDPSKPAIDKFVLEHFKLSLPYPKAKNRLERVVDVYESLCELFSELVASPTGSMILDCFDRRFGHTNLTALKRWTSYFGRFGLSQRTLAVRDASILSTQSGRACQFWADAIVTNERQSSPIIRLGLPSKKAKPPRSGSGGTASELRVGTVDYGYAAF